METPAARRWLDDRRRALREEIAGLEDALLDAGATPAHAPGYPTSGDDYARVVQPLEEHASALRAQLLRAGLTPPATAGPGGGNQPAAQMHGAPADWLDRLADAQRQAATAEVRAARAEALRATDREDVERVGAAIVHLTAAVQQLTGITDPSETAGESADAAVSLSTMEATRHVLQSIGPKMPVTAAQVGEGVSRILKTDANPGTVRSNLVRLRDVSSGGSTVGHDEQLGVWWLIDPHDPTWRPPRLQAVSDSS